MRFFAALCLCGVFFAAACAQDTPDPAEEAPAPSNQAGASALSRPAPDFSAPTLDGGTFRLSDHLGEVVLINFWATWCGPCVFETPELVDLYDDLGEKGLTVVGISLDEEGFDVIEPFAERFEVTYPMIMDDGTVAGQYGGILALPTTFVVDKSGILVSRFIGLFPTEDMRPELEKMLAATSGLTAR